MCIFRKWSLTVCKRAPLGKRYWLEFKRGAGSCEPAALLAVSQSAVERGKQFVVPWLRGPLPEMQIHPLALEGEEIVHVRPVLRRVGNLDEVVSFFNFYRLIIN